MGVLITVEGLYRLYQYDTEEDFESRMVKHIDTIVGEKCLFIDCKRRIGKYGKKQSIPDAYLLDFNSNIAPRLFVVETEMASHDLFQHVSAQLVQFFYSFTSAPRRVKQVLLEEISKNQEIYETCELKAKEYGMRNIDNMLDQLVNDKFRVLIIIDDAKDEFNKVINTFRFPVEVIEVKTYVEEKGNFIYQFTPLFEDVTGAKESIEKREHRTVDISEFDTIVVPAQEEGFQEVFIGENRWYAIRMHASMIPQIKYIAGYRVAPISAITHWALVKNIEPWGNTGKYCVNFVDVARQIEPIQLVPKSRVKALQSPRYASFDRLQKAKNLDEAF